MSRPQDCANIARASERFVHRAYRTTIHVCNTPAMHDTGSCVTVKLNVKLACVTVLTTHVVNSTFALHFATLYRIGYTGNEALCYPRYKLYGSPN